MAYQSLYRRYRPQTFGQIRGQQHVVNALQNAVVKGEVGHAYLFHGPRGTGKTTSARVLAKALNCENLGADGEPCCACESCIAIEQGRSFDLHELDAASNNKVEDMRDLLAKVNLGTPGRAKVYILDEVHMLTSQAENALLKTLEEPPDHVTWVLATTEPHKVVETIRSRCQVFQLTLLGADEMADHVRWVIEDAGLDVADEAIDHVVAAGGGSARDTLSALDRVVAAGGVVEVDTTTDLMIDAIAGHDVAAALAAVGEAAGRGRDPRTIGEAVLAGLRDGFLTSMGSPQPRLSPTQIERAGRLAAAMSPAAMTRAMETLGTALVDMRQAPDPRVDLEVALVRLCRPAADRSLDALTDRVEQLEAALAAGPPVTPDGAAPAAGAAAAPAAQPDPRPVEPEGGVAGGAPTVPATPSPVGPAASVAPAAPAAGPAAAARRALAEKRGGAAPAAAPVAEEPTDPGPPPVVPAAAAAGSPTPPSAPMPAADPPTATSSETDLRSIRPLSPTEVVQLGSLHLAMTKDQVIAEANRFLADRPRNEEALAALWVSLVDQHQRGRSPVSPDPEPAFGADGDPGPTPPDEGEPAPIPKTSSPAIVREVAPPTEPLPQTPERDAQREDEEHIDLDDLVDAPSHTDQLIERLTEAFPGAELHTTEPPEDDR